MQEAFLHKKDMDTWRHTLPVYTEDTGRWIWRGVSGLSKQDTRTSRSEAYLTGHGLGIGVRNSYLKPSLPCLVKSWVLNSLATRWIKGDFGHRESWVTDKQGRRAACQTAVMAEVGGWSSRRAQMKAALSPFTTEARWEAGLGLF